jgi:hypothetical protein
MLRFKVLVAAVPLMAAAVFAKIELAPSPHPCVAVGADSVELGSAPVHADLHVDFTDDPARATVRVALADDPETADFVVVDDASANEDQRCGITAATQVVALSADPDRHGPLVYLTHDGEKTTSGPADYRIYVRSSRITTREAAALIVGARYRAASRPHAVL